MSISEKRRRALFASLESANIVPEGLDVEITPEEEVDAFVVYLKNLLSS